VLIQAGEFMMGNSHTVEEEIEAFKPYGIELKGDYFQDERPRHLVRITKPFYLAQCPVTVGHFRRFVQDTGYKTDAEKGENKGAIGWDPAGRKFDFKPEYYWRNVGFNQTSEHPAVCVSWNDAVAFCEWLGRKEGKAYRLPTEAEWEYACRAGTTTRYWSGDDPESLAKVANVADGTAKKKFPWWKTIRAKDGHVFTSPVGQFRPNPFGLYDVHGNVWEWCADWYGEEYYAISPVDDPAGPDSGSSRVFRGGSCVDRPSGHRSASRDWGSPGDRSAYAGFRVAITP
jgi:formylglycine-generating enzyme required for sulfatase activity